MRNRQRMRPATPASTAAETVVAPVCPEPGCQLQPPPWGGKHPGLHMAIEHEGKRPLYSWWGKLDGKFRCMDGDNLNRAMDRILDPLT